MSSGQARTDLNTYWINFNDTNGTRKKKCKRSRIHKTFTNPTYVNRVKCVVDTLNSVVRNNTPRINLTRTTKPILRGRKYTPDEQADFNAYHKRVDEEEAAAIATARNENNNNSPASPAAASPTSASDALASAPPAAAPVAAARSAASNNTNDEANDENEGNHLRATDLRPARASARALAAARARAAARAAAAPSAAPAAPSAAPAAASAASRYSANRSATSTAGVSRTVLSPQLSKMTVEEKFTNVKDQQEINKLIFETIFKNDQREKNKYIIELNDMRGDPSRYLIFFQTSTSLSRDYNGHRYKLFKNGNKFELETQDTPSASKGGRRRKTQKKNKHKKRTTSKRR